MKKVLFLDCDGVINNEDTDILSPAGFIGIDPRNFELLVDFVKDNDMEIVLSSTWQNHPRMYQYLQEELEKEGLSIAGVTHERSINRGKGITQYVEVHQVDQWIVFDDYYFPDFESEGIDPHLVLTNFNYGLQPRDIIKANLLLNHFKEE